MPRHWEPLPHEVNLFEEIYIDETSQNDHHFLVLGGMIMPRVISARFEADIIEARQPRLVSRSSKGSLQEIGWKTVTTGTFDAYRAVVDAYFSFAQRNMQSIFGPFQFFASVIDLTVPGRRYTGSRGHIGFDREIYFHCMSIARREKRMLFHVYPDFRSTKEPIQKLKAILNSGIEKEQKGRRSWPFRRLMFRHSHEVQAIQVSDLLIGAIAYRLNRHYDAANENPDKKALCEYILRRGGFWQFIGEKGFRENARGHFIVWFRRHND